MSVAANPSKPPSNPAGSKVRVVLIDDHAMVRQALAAVLAESEGIEIVGQGADVPSAVEFIRAGTCDVLVLDYNLPGGGALSVIEEVARRKLKTRVLILTVHESTHYAVRVLEAGAAGYMVKSGAVEELYGAIRTVHSGEVYVSPKLAAAVLDHLRRPKRERTGLAALSDREFELLRLLARGVGLKEAAEALSVSVSAASTYRARLLKKLDLSSTSELIRFAIENDLVE
jgi:DNA-binding NarL/FixJ family response regulator